MDGGSNGGSLEARRARHHRPRRAIKSGGLGLQIHGVPGGGAARGWSQRDRRGEILKMGVVAGLESRGGAAAVGERRLPAVNGGFRRIWPEFEVNPNFKVSYFRMGISIMQKYLALVKFGKLSIRNRCTSYDVDVNWSSDRIILKLLCLLGLIFQYSCVNIS